MNQSPQIASLHQQLLENVRLRIGIAVIAILGIFYIGLDVRDAAHAEESEFQMLSEELAELELLADGQDWAFFLKREKEVAEKLSPYFWGFQSAGLAQAEMQTTLESWIDKERVQGFRMDVGLPVPSDIPGVSRVSARLSGELETKQLYRLLRNVALHMPLVEVVEARVLRSRKDDARKVELLLIANFMEKQ